MQITEKNTEGLTRELEVVVNATLVEEKLHEHLTGLNSKVSIPGFRPGKAPMNIIRKQHGKTGLNSVIQPLMNDLCNDVLKERKERQLTQVLYFLPKKWEDSILAGQDISVVLTYEVFPEIDLKPFSDFKVPRPVYEVTEDAVNSSILQLAGYGELYEKRPEGESAQMGDRLTVSFDAKEGGKKIEQLSVEDSPVILGQATLHSEIDNELVGTKVGEYRKKVVTLPENFWQTENAGKEVEFEIHVLDLEKKKNIEINDELAQNLGCKTVSELKTLVQERLEDSFKNQSNQEAKDALTIQLLDSHEFLVTNAMIDAELDIGWREYQHRIEHNHSSESVKVLTEDEYRTTFREYFDRKVRISLILYAYADKYDIKVTEGELKNAVQSVIKTHADPEAMKAYLSKPENLAEYQRLLNSQLTLQKIWDYILERVEITEEIVESRDVNITEGDTDEVKEKVDDNTNKASVK